MYERLEVKVAEQTGKPYVEVPRQAMWDLVEYLALQRTPVHYSYQPHSFTVQFLRLGRAAAQTMLDRWTAQESATEEPRHAVT